MNQRALFDPNFRLVMRPDSFRILLLTFEFCDLRFEIEFALISTYTCGVFCLKSQILNLKFQRRPQSG
jgi:hypothetical protein